VPRVIQRIAVQAGADVVEKWAGRLIPVVSSAIGCALNYYFVRGGVGGHWRISARSISKRAAGLQRSKCNSREQRQQCCRREPMGTTIGH